MDLLGQGPKIPRWLAYLLAGAIGALALALLVSVRGCHHLPWLGR